MEGVCSERDALHVMCTYMCVHGSQVHKQFHWLLVVFAWAKSQRFGDADGVRGVRDRRWWMCIWQGGARGRARCVFFFGDRIG